MGVGPLVSEGDAMSYVWTEEKPTKTGWYWWLSVPGSDPHACHIQQEGRWRARFITGNYADVQYLGGQWSGPIEEPVEESSITGHVCHACDGTGVTYD